MNSGGKQTHLEGGCDKHPIWLMETEGEINTGKDRMHLTAIICKMAAAVQAFGWLGFWKVQTETYGMVHHKTI